MIIITTIRTYSKYKPPSSTNIYSKPSAKAAPQCRDAGKANSGASRDVTVRSPCHSGWVGWVIFRGRPHVGRWFSNLFRSLPRSRQYGVSSCQSSCPVVHRRPTTISRLLLIYRGVNWVLYNEWVNEWMSNPNLSRSRSSLHVKDRYRTVGVVGPSSYTVSPDSTSRIEVKDFMHIYISGVLFFFFSFLFFLHHSRSLDNDTNTNTNTNTPT